MATRQELWMDREEEERGRSEGGAKEDGKRQAWQIDVRGK